MNKHILIGELSKLEVKSYLKLNHPDQEDLNIF